MFATLTGDTNPLHMDAEYAREGIYGKKVCHGLLIVSYAAGLINKVGYVDGSTIALRQMEWQFRFPVFPGDTIYVTVTIKGKRKLTDKEGVVNAEINIFNQHDEICVSGSWKMIVALHPNVEK
jgi:acyl dehydratase